MSLCAWGRKAELTISFLDLEAKCLMSLVEILGLENIVNILDSTNFLISYLGDRRD